MEFKLSYSPFVLNLKKLFLTKKQLQNIFSHSPRRDHVWRPRLQHRVDGSPLPPPPLAAWPLHEDLWRLRRLRLDAVAVRVDAKEAGGANLKKWGGEKLNTIWQLLKKSISIHDIPMVLSYEVT